MAFRLDIDTIKNVVPATCCSCNMLFYYSYCRQSDAKKIYYTNSASMPFFMLSPKTAFSETYLNQISSMVDVSAVSFKSVTEQYLAMTDCVIEPQLVEEVYFLVKLVDTFNAFDQSLEVSNDAESSRKDIELICKQALETMVNLLNMAEDHTCDAPGCSERFIMADGIERVILRHFEPNA